MLTEDPKDDPIKMNHAKNIQMFFSKTICDSLKNVVLEDTAVETYETLLSLKPDSNVKRLAILKKVQDIDSSDIEAYVIAMQDIQKELKDIDLKMEYYETKPPAHMNRLLKNLSEEQTKQIHFYRMEKWEDPSEATKIDVFKMGLILIKKFQDIKFPDTANMAKEKYSGQKFGGKSFGGKCKEDHPSWVPDHNYDYCDKNPNTKDPKGRDERIARRKARNDKRSGNKTMATTTIETESNGGSLKETFINQGG